ncbi:hypothetical protein AMECASPLE_025536 [Ameca splendens]|uniref:Uncharacterized protein n=1 Tax=Ameca splendens TaxID=208324 RepID=A0ABV0YSW8_9TELE
MMFFSISSLVWDQSKAKLEGVSVYEAEMQQPVQDVIVNETNILFALSSFLHRFPIVIQFLGCLQHLTLNRDCGENSDGITKCGGVFFMKNIMPVKSLHPCWSFHPVIAFVTEIMVNIISYF